MLAIGYPAYGGYGGSPYYSGSNGWYMAGSQGNDVPPGSLFSSCPGCAYYGNSGSYGGYGGGYNSYPSYGGGYGYQQPAYGYQQQGYSNYGYQNSGYVSGSPMVNTTLPQLGYPIYGGNSYGGYGGYGGGGWYL